MAGVTSALIGDVMATLGRAPAWCGPRDALVQALGDVVRPNDLVVTMGAGDVTRSGHELLAILTAKPA
jgi:UDP-N-acetylmuramate--alanine ligase